MSAGVRRHSTRLEWYAYLHVEGAIIVKRYQDSRDIIETRESDFVRMVTGPYEAKNRDVAIDIAKARLAC